MRLPFIASVIAAITLPLQAGSSDLTVLEWAGFDVPELFQSYVDKHGKGPSFVLFGNDDEAFQKMASGFRADIGHPCSQMVLKYRDAGLIEPFDISRIPQFATIEPQFLNSDVFQDEAGVWYLPVDWGTLAIAYNADTVPPEDVSTLQIFVDPKYAGRTSLPNSSDDIWALAYLATGTTDWGNVSDEDFVAAAEWLRRAHQNVVAYWTDPSELAQLMASGAVDVSWSWNDAVVLLQEDNYNVGFQREPIEGSSIFYCGFVNFKDGPGNEDLVYDFVNAWLSPETAKPLLDEVGYGHTSSEAMAQIKDEPAVISGLGPIDAPLLSQTPGAPELRQKQLLEFERIKAGF